MRPGMRLSARRLLTGLKKVEIARSHLVHFLFRLEDAFVDFVEYVRTFCRSLFRSCPEYERKARKRRMISLRLSPMG